MKFGEMIRNTVVGTGLAVVFAGAAAAATFTINGGTSTSLPANFDPYCGGCTSPAPGDAVTAFVGGTGAGNGLHISGSSDITFTFLGKEAGAQNALFAFGGSSITNTGGLGAAITAYQTGPGFVNMMFQTAEGAGWEDLNGNGVMGDLLSIHNNGSADYSGLAIAFGSVFNNGQSVLAFFGDGRGDIDYDDMVVRIDIVPLPASALMLLGAVGGLGALRLRKKKS